MNLYYFDGIRLRHALNQSPTVVAGPRFDETLGAPSLARSCFCAKGGMPQLSQSSFRLLNVQFCFFLEHDFSHADKVHITNSGLCPEGVTVQANPGGFFPARTAENESAEDWRLSQEGGGRNPRSISSELCRQAANKEKRGVPRPHEKTCCRGTPFPRSALFL